MRHNILKLTSSGALVQLGSLLLLAIIGRQYSESIMGQIGLFLTWGGVLAMPSAARYEQAIVVAPSVRESMALYRLCLRIVTIYASLLLICVGLLFFFFAPTPLGLFLFALPLFVLLQGANEASGLLSLRFKNYNRLAIAQTVQGLGNNGLKATLGAFSPTLGSLIAASLISVVTSLGLLLSSLKPRCQFPRAPQRLRQRVLLRKWCNFPRYGIVQVLAETFLASLIVLMLPWGYGLEEVGLVTMAIMLSKRPVNVLSLAVGKVFFQRLSEQINAKVPIGRTIKKLFWRTLAIGLPALLILWWLMDYAVIIVVGEKWQPASHVIRWMMPPMLVAFLTSILNVLPDILARQRSNMYAVLLLLAFEASVAAIGMRFFDFEGFIVFFCLAELLARSIYLGFLFHLARCYDLAAARLA